MATTPYDDRMLSMDGEKYMPPDLYYETKTPSSDEWDEFLRIEGLKKTEDSIYPNFLEYWMFWS